MVKIYVFTLGFTSEFVIKPLLEAGVENDTYVTIIYTLTKDDYSRKRVRDALTYIEKLARDGGFLDRTFFQQVSLEGTFYDTVYEVVTALSEVMRRVAREEVEKADVWLTGGMRVLVIATLIACRMLFECLNVPAEYHVWSEDGTYKYSFGSQLVWLDPKRVSRTKMEILKKIVSLGEAVYEELAGGERKEATVRKVVEFLRKDNLIQCKRRRRRVVCSATKLGELIVEVSELVERDL